MNIEYTIRCLERKFSLPDFDEVEHTNNYYCDHGFKNKKITKSQRRWDATMKNPPTIPDKINFVISSPDVKNARKFKTRELADDLRKLLPKQIQQGHKFYLEYDYYIEVQAGENSA